MADSHVPQSSKVQIDREELAKWKIVAGIADVMLWPCRRHQRDGCGDNCTACRMRTALQDVGLGVGLKPYVDEEPHD